MLFVSCFLSGLFLTALGGSNGSTRLYEDMMMAFCFLYFFIIQSAMLLYGVVFRVAAHTSI